jgi:signal transduction histidine kinase
MRASSRISMLQAFNASGWRLAQSTLVNGVKRWLAGFAKARSTSQTDVATGRTTWINTFRARSDKVIAIGRIMLAIGSFYIAWLDSAHPPSSPNIVFALLIAYFAYAVTAAVLVWKTEISRVRGTLIRHVIDVVAFVAFMFLTGGASSPFFMFMPFALLAATLHWRWKGALWTGLICVLVLLYLAAADNSAPIDPDVDATTNVSRIMFVTVAGILLIWLGAHQEAVRTELLRLAEKTPGVPDGRDWPAIVALEYAAHVMQVPRVLLIWTDAEEPWTYLARWADGASRVMQLPPNTYLPWTAEALHRASLLVTDAMSGRMLVHQGEGRFDRWSGVGAAISPDLVADFSMVSAVSVPFHVGDIEARLFLLDPPTLSLDDVAIAEIIADRLKILFQQAILVRKLSDAAALEERVRIGRDLHDGVLQSLAGTAMQLQALRSSDTGALETLDERLSAIQSMLAGEQRDLRAFIRALEPGHEYRSAADFQLALQFEALADRLRQQWSIDFHYLLNPADLRLPATTIYELTRMVSEATANAVRHGAARTVEARLSLDAGAIVLTIDDDGTGFGLSRRHEHAELASGNVGPRSLRERAAAIGGELAIDKLGQWTRIVINFPVHP